MCVIFWAAKWCNHVARRERIYNFTLPEDLSEEIGVAFMQELKIHGFRPSKSIGHWKILVVYYAKCRSMSCMFVNHNIKYTENDRLCSKGPAVTEALRWWQPKLNSKNKDIFVYVPTFSWFLLYLWFHKEKWISLNTLQFSVQLNIFLKVFVLFLLSCKLF